MKSAEEMKIVSKLKLPLKISKEHQEICQNDGTGIFSIYFGKHFTQIQSERDEVVKIMCEAMNRFFASQFKEEGGEEKAITKTYSKEEVANIEYQLERIDRFIELDEKAQEGISHARNILLHLHDSAPSFEGKAYILPEELRKEEDWSTPGMVDAFLREHPEYRCLDVIGKFEEWMRDKLKS